MSEVTRFIQLIEKEEAKVDCCSISSIEEINDKYNYDDSFGPSKKDRELVSCGQNGSYNELEHIYKTKLKKYVENKTFSELAAVRALCEACYELKSPRKRADFYKLLSEKLKVDIT